MEIKSGGEGLTVRGCGADQKAELKKNYGLIREPLVAQIFNLGMVILWLSILLATSVCGPFGLFEIVEF